MLALTLTQPWASLVVWGEKWLETRSWSTHYRGTLAIHAAKAMPRWAKDLCEDEDGPFFAAMMRHNIAWHSALPRGAVLGGVQLVNVVPTSQIDLMSAWSHERLKQEPCTVIGGPSRYIASEKEEAFGDFGPGRFAWVLEGAYALPGPIPARGQLGLWEWGARPRPVPTIPTEPIGSVRGSENHRTNMMKPLWVED